ncbi:COX15/CtaA family protein [Cellulomonas composti]|uniref:Protein required for cytochrome oxidase assembly n=1 Tax=Cellulomonas composti TaxID=266130 RepID=A0A511J5S9_9CELL|nr:COX15/CtaA family protein [Cellulomonas composti]GEL93357.1 protein required for cytochrome oxidase assembly [Cellulomonas composti]
MSTPPPTVEVSAPWWRRTLERMRWYDLLAWLRRRTHAVLVTNLVLQIAIIGTGGAVRLTASGLGCSSWPQCEPGTFVPEVHDQMTYHPFVEFGNRLMTFVLTAGAVAVAYVVWSDRSRGLAYRRLGWLPLGGVLGQAVLGGILVIKQLPPILVSLHFLVSSALVAGSLLLLHRSQETDDRPRPLVDPATRQLTHVLGGVLGVVLVLGTLTTGAGPHSGDDEVGYRLAVDPLLMARIHAAWVWLFALVLLVVLWRTRRGGPAGASAAAMHRAAVVLLVITLAQGAIGYVQTATGLPIALVNLHLIGAALLTAGTTRVWLCGRTRTADLAVAVPAA